MCLKEYINKLIYWYKMITYMNTLLNKLFKIETRILGRWCHISMPKCCKNIIDKKIDFANRDNSF